MISETDLYILSYYRHSEIEGALFFGNLAKTFKSDEITKDLSKHFADESYHAWLWTECIYRLEGEPLKMEASYQKKYLEAVGLPINKMEVLAITNVFEKRVIAEYAKHRKSPDLNPVIRDTLEKIMKDEQWHIHWIRKALESLEEKYGKDVINQTLKRYGEADEDIYAQTLKDHDPKIAAVFK